MKMKALRFFSPEDNIVKVEGEKKQIKPIPTGYISKAGKLVFPMRSLTLLEFNPDTIAFQIGAEEGKRKLKSIFMVPAKAGDDKAFTLTKSAKSYSIPFEVILKRRGVDYNSTKYIFDIVSFEYEEGVLGYELQLSEEAPKPPIEEGVVRRRGRKPKEVAVA